MPTNCMFYGILVRMHVSTREHAPAHVHAYYGEYSATFDILKGERIEGVLPSRQRRLMEAWIELRREELMADWLLAESGEELFMIEPL